MIKHPEWENCDYLLWPLWYHFPARLIDIAGSFLGLWREFLHEAKRERVPPGGSPPWAKDEEWPKCHFRPMTLHTSCSDTSGNSDGYECDHCGHTVPLVQWIETLKQKRKKQMTDQEKIDALTEALKFYAGSFYPTRCRFTPALEWNPKEELLDDCGNIAAAALEKVGGV